MAIAPAAEVILFTDPYLTSPAAKMPGMLVSNIMGALEVLSGEALAAR